MKILVIILIIVAIVQSLIFIWCDLLQYIRNKAYIVLQETMKNVQKDFMVEKEHLRNMIDERDKVITSLTERLKDEIYRVELLERQLEMKDTTTTDINFKKGE